jgi:hypothetical protein
LIFTSYSIAARAGVNVRDMYEYGLENVKDLIKDKEDLKIGREVKIKKSILTALVSICII